jgi:putative transposase
LDEQHVWTAVRYVERNPVRAGMVSKAWEYPWSSAAGHCGKRDDPLLSDPCELQKQIGAAGWSELLGAPWEEEASAGLALHRRTQTGRPAGSEGFVCTIQTLLGRTLRAKKIGRPRKPREAEK